VRKKFTIQDVAREAGTSVSTVSRVLTGSTPVSDEKRHLVEEAIERLGYRPSLVARSLKTQTTYSIGLLINDITNPFYSVVAWGVEEEAIQQGYSLILCNTNEDPKRELHYLQVLRDKQVDGIIFGPTGQNAKFVSKLASQMPLVQIDRYLPDVRAAAVLVDNESGAYRAVRHLIDKGHRRIGILGFDIGVTTTYEREAGYERALREAGISPDHSCRAMPSDYSRTTVYELTMKLLDQASPVTALFATNNQLGLTAMRAIRKTGLRIPDDIALIVFDDMEVFTLTTPPISAVAQPAALIGERAMKLLVQQIADPSDHLPEVTILPTELMLRGSV
jgi:DNA-binding LacI/PurR family transcriptional regulator